MMAARVPPLRTTFALSHVSTSRSTSGSGRTAEDAHVPKASAARPLAPPEHVLNDVTHVGGLDDQYKLSVSARGVGSSHRVGGSGSGSVYAFIEAIPAGGDKAADPSSTTPDGSGSLRVANGGYVRVTPSALSAPTPTSVIAPNPSLSAARKALPRLAQRIQRQKGDGLAPGEGVMSAYDITKVNVAPAIEPALHGSVTPTHTTPATHVRRTSIPTAHDHEHEYEATPLHATAASLSHPPTTQHALSFHSSALSAHSLEAPRATNGHALGTAEGPYVHSNGPTSISTHPPRAPLSSKGANLSRLQLSSGSSEGGSTAPSSPRGTNANTNTNTNTGATPAANKSSTPQGSMHTRSQSGSGKDYNSIVDGILVGRAYRTTLSPTRSTATATGMSASGMSASGAVPFTASATASVLSGDTPGGVIITAVGSAGMTRERATAASPHNKAHPSHTHTLQVSEVEGVDVIPTPPPSGRVDESVGTSPQLNVNLIDEYTGTSDSPLDTKPRHSSAGVVATPVTTTALGSSPHHTLRPGITTSISPSAGMAAATAGAGVGVGGVVADDAPAGEGLVPVTTRVLGEGGYAPPSRRASYADGTGPYASAMSVRALNAAAAADIDANVPQVNGYVAGNVQGRHEFKGTTVLPDTATMLPTFAPGSPFDLAMQAKVQRKKRIHKPDALKRLQQGVAEFEEKKAAKELGRIINKEHKQYQTSFGMMLGIYTSVVNTQLGAEKLVLDDFMKVRKLVFPPGGSPLTPPHALPTSFKFKDYAPKVFHHLRQRFSIDQKHYLSSLGGAYEYIEFNSNSKSGSFFFYSHDGKFMIKTQSPGESKFLRRLLAHYYQYVMTHPHTYITRFYGMHRIKMPHLRRKIHFVVMQSVFYGDNDIHEMYDLKGSTVGRAATEKEKARGPANCVYKDQDLMHSGTKVHLGPARREAFLEQIRQDAEFLHRMQIMDYSLLLGIHHKSQRDTAVPHALVHTGAPGSASEEGGEGEVEGEEAVDVTTTVDAAGTGAGAGGGTSPARRVHAPRPSGFDLEYEAEAEGEGAGVDIGAESKVDGGRSTPHPLGETRESAGLPPAVQTQAYSGPGRDTLMDMSASPYSVGSPALHSSRHPYDMSREYSSMASTGAATPAYALLAMPAVGVGGGGSGGVGSRYDLMRDAHIRATIARGGGVTGIEKSNLHTTALGESLPRVNPPHASRSAGMGIQGIASDGVTPTDEIYYFGIIDILQQYDLRKMGETALRSLYQNPKGISAVSPAFYAERFVDFLAKHTA